MRNHPKVKAIRTKFPEFGYTAWCMILEYLTGADGNVFKYSDLQFELLAGDFNIASGNIKAVVDYAITLELLFNREGYINSDSLDGRLARVYAKRGRTKDLSEEQKRDKITAAKVPSQPNENKKAKAPRKPKENSASNSSDYTECVKYWYEDFRQSQWTFRAVHGKALKGIIKQIENLIAKNPPKEGQDPLTVVQMFQLILSKLPDFFKSKDLPIIDSKFNEIIEQIKTENLRGKSNGRASEYAN